MAFLGRTQEGKTAGRLVRQSQNGAELIFYLQCIDGFADSGIALHLRHVVQHVVVINRPRRNLGEARDAWIPGEPSAGIKLVGKFLRIAVNFRRDGFEGRVMHVERQGAGTELISELG